MFTFFSVSFSYPVIIYTILVVCSVFFWMLSFVGMLDLDSFTSIETGDLYAPGMDNTSSATGISGLLIKFKLHEIPFTVIFSVVSICAWLCSYLLYRFFAMPLRGYSFFYYLLGTIIFIGSGILGFVIASYLLRPINKRLAKMNKTQTTRSILGQIAVVRSSVVNKEKGEAIFEDGGAGMILQIRSIDENEFVRGDRVALIQFDESTHTYHVMSEESFLQ